MAVKIYHGDILFTPSADRLEIHENSYIVVEEGVVSQICEKIPKEVVKEVIKEVPSAAEVAIFFKTEADSYKSVRGRTCTDKRKSRAVWKEPTAIYH